MDAVDLEDVVDNMHLNVTQFPAFAILEPNANLRYPMNEASNPWRHLFWISSAATYSPRLSQPPLPSEDSKEALVKIIGLNYKDIVIDNSRDVLVMYSITPCGPCEALEPTLEALAGLYASSPQLKDQVRIGKVMYDANNTPERGIRGFPTIKLFPAASKGSPEMYLGDRTLDDIADFIRDKGTFDTDFRRLEEHRTEGQEPLPVQKPYGSEDGACAATRN